LTNLIQHSVIYTRISHVHIVWCIGCGIWPSLSDAIECNAFFIKRCNSGEIARIVYCQQIPLIFSHIGFILRVHIPIVGVVSLVVLYLGSCFMLFFFSTEGTHFHVHVLGSLCELMLLCCRLCSPLYYYLASSYFIVIFKREEITHNQIAHNI